MRSNSAGGTLRNGRPSVVGRIHEGRLLLDLRSVPPRDDERIVAAFDALQSAKSAPPPDLTEPTPVP